MRSAALRRLLGLCASPATSAEHESRLQAVLAELPDFEELVEEAEEHGIAPLVALHLGSRTAVPTEVRRGLIALGVRHTLAHRARATALGEALSALAAEGLDHLVLKGAALAELVYPRPELRAMRDVDLLLRDRDIARAERALEAVGFSERTVARPGRHEVVTRARTLGGFQVTLDLHRRLGLLALPDYAQAPRQTLDELLPDSQALTIGGTSTRAPGREDLVRSVFRHGFCLQLDEDRLRYNSIADLVAAMERWVDVLDWSRLARLDPAVFRSLGLLHHLTPLSDKVRDALGYHPRRAPYDIGNQYWGWPRRWRRHAAISPSFLAATVFPSEWWMRLRHGGGAGPVGLARAWGEHVNELGCLLWRALRHAPRVER